MTRPDLPLVKKELERLWAKTVARRKPITGFTARYERYETPDNYTVLSDWFAFQVGERWPCSARTTLRLRTRLTAPDVPAGHTLALELNVGGEASVRVNGRLMESLTGIPEGYDRPYRDKLRERVVLPGDWAGQVLDVEIEACMNFQWCNETTYVDQEQAVPALFARADVVLVDDSLFALCHDLQAACDALDCIKDARLIPRLTDAVWRALTHSDDPAAARAQLADALSAMPEGQGRVLFTGQAHIDTAWLWTIRESIRKCERTFANVLDLMDRYPDFTFSFSQPCLFAYTEKHYPDLFKRIQKRVAEGRIELVGNAWVEMDANIPSGESLVRQLLYGRAYYLKAFGRESEVFWMPDVFGYSWALPQIITRSGGKYFYTTKLNSNDTNRFPHSLFVWRGVDGTRLLSYLQRRNYNGVLDAHLVSDIDRLFDQKDVSDQCLMTFGYGDGGGGPTAEMLEQYQRLERFPGLPRARMATAQTFFAEAETLVDQLPEWNDEMYYENHRGTYTSQAFVKKCNRAMELLLRKLEIACATAHVYLQYPYPMEQISDLWREMLTLQFHDILPGSSIHAVYEECRETYQNLTARAQALMDDVMAALSAHAGAGNDQWNFGPYEERGVAPFFCGKTLRESGQTTVTGHTLENDALLVALAPDGTIARLYDKQHAREVLAPGERGNVLTLFEDKPIREQAWNIDATYQDRGMELPGAQSIETITRPDGSPALQVIWTHGETTITQDIVLRPGARRLDFVTRVNWQERDRMLKCAFPVDIHASHATYEIQFGAITRPTHRNTSYDRAKFEACGHRWADLSEGNYGVSLLNDSKYGYDILGNRMRLTLLRSPSFPDPFADQGMQEFTYALYPHAGDWRTGTVREAYRLNVPMETHAGSGNGLPGPLARLASDHAVLDTIKQAEDSNGIILRIYESAGARGPIHITFALPPASVTECDLMEREEQTVEVVNNACTVYIKPYQIKTYRVVF